jgi:hypothetical protein
MAHARAHLRPIGFFALVVYVHQLLQIRLDRSALVLMIIVLLDAPLWISARLVISLVVSLWRYVATRTLQSDVLHWTQDADDEDTLNAPPSPTMLLVSIATIRLAPTAVALMAAVLCVGLDSFRAEQGRRIIFICTNKSKELKRVAHVPILRHSTTLALKCARCVLVYDAFVLPVLVILWAGIPALFTITGEATYSPLLAFTVYLVALPACAAFSRTVGDSNG